MPFSNLYNIIEISIRDFKHCIKFEDNTTHIEVRDAIRWVMRNNPDIFWFSHQYQYDEPSSTINFQYTFSVERVKTIQQSINDVIENDFCIEYVKTLTKQEQIVYVYKWLVSYCNYNVNSAYNQSIYSIFVRRNSVCTGYAKATQYLFNLLGIESRLVFGRLHNDKEDGRHCWNLVKVDNEYYHFDACFGDSILDNVAIKSGVQELFKIDGINYNFLCVSTAEFLRTRNIEDITTLPDCPNSWSKTLINSLALIKLKQREDIKGCLLSHIGSSADIYLCSKDKKIVLKVFRPNSKTTSLEEYHYMQLTKGCRHLLQCNEDYTDITQNIVAIEQSSPILDLLCSHYYELSLEGLIKMATDVAKAWKECQKRGVLYRDIHVCNIYRSNDGIFKLGDFGSCTSKLDLKEVAGNQWFMAPETFVSGIFTETSAVYSISMVMYFILNNLRPAFYAQACDDEALQKRMNGNCLPIPAGCINLPPHIKKELNKFFRAASASLPKERISSVTEFIYELERLSFYCKDSNYIIHSKGFSLDFNLNAGPKVKLDAHWHYISRDAYHQYAKGDDIEQMCTTACFEIDDFTSNDEIVSVDRIEDFARTRGCSNDNWDLMRPNNSPKCDEWSSNFIVDEVENLSQFYALDSDGDSSIYSDNYSRITTYNDAILLGNSDTCYMYDSVNTLDSSLFTYESTPKNKSTGIQKTAVLKTVYNETISSLNQEQIRLNSVFSQIDVLKKKIYKIEFQKNNPSKPKKSFRGVGGSILFGPLGTIVGGFAGIFACSTIKSSNDASESGQEILLECKKELEAKMAQAQICKKQIEEFKQQKYNLEKELAVLEEQNKYNEVYSSIFAPAEVKRKSHLQVQVYLHLYEESEKVKSLAQESDKNAERRDYIPLSLKLKKGDKVDVKFNVFGETRLISEHKSIIWQGSFSKCSFDYFVQKDIDVDELSCEAILSVNGAIIGEMRFITQIVKTPRNLNPEIISHRFNKIFISYAHEDIQKVKYLAQAYKAQGVDYFFDRDILKAGDIYDEIIFNYIDSSDLFILCWSKNAEQSNYVKQEKDRAMKHAYPQLSRQEATLKIYPLSIDPKTELPSDMIEIYNFGEL